jgi:hypothetical protein
MVKELAWRIYLSVNLYLYIYPISREQPKGKRREERKGPRQEEDRDRVAGRDEGRFRAQHTKQDVAT